MTDKEYCCNDIQEAIHDNVISNHKSYGFCIVIGDGISQVPINYCPWCGKPLTTGLYNSPSMLYRP